MANPVSTSGTTSLVKEHNYVSSSLDAPASEAVPKEPKKKPVPVSMRILENEALDVILKHPATPEAWKRNIPAFLRNCRLEVPYISSWAWAVKVMQSGWCKSAPFKYFKMVLVNPKHFKQFGSGLRSRQLSTYHWLKRTRGWRAAVGYANKVKLFPLTPAQKWRKAKAEIDEKTRRGMAFIRNGLEPPPEMTIEEFEAERRYRKELLLG